MRRKNNMSLLKSGDKVIAIDRSGQSLEYIFMGIELADLEDGVGCSYIKLRSMNMGGTIGVEAAWFAERTILKV